MYSLHIYMLKHKICITSYDLYTFHEKILKLLNFKYFTLKTIYNKIKTLLLYICLFLNFKYFTLKTIYNKIKTLLLYICLCIMYLLYNILFKKYLKNINVYYHMIYVHFLQKSFYS